MNVTKLFPLFFLIILFTGCSRQPQILSRMELQQNGQTLATIRFTTTSHGLSQAQAFDSQSRWLFTVQPQKEKGRLLNVTYSSSGGTQRATYEHTAPDTLTAVFQTTDDFQRNRMSLAQNGRVIHRSLSFQRQPLSYEIDLSWADGLPERIEYSYRSNRFNIPTESGGALVFEYQKGLVTGVAIQDDNLDPEHKLHIVCHYARGKGVRHDWSEPEFYLPSPLLLLSIYSSYNRGE